MLLIGLSANFVSAQEGSEIYYEDFSGGNPNWYCPHDVTVSNGPSGTSCSVDDSSAYVVAGESGSASSGDGACGYTGVARDFSFESANTLEMSIKATADSWGSNAVVLQDSDGYHVLWANSGGGSGNNIGWFTESFDISSYDSDFTLIIGNADTSSRYCSYGDHGFKTWGDDITIYGDNSNITVSNPAPSDTTSTGAVSKDTATLEADITHDLGDSVTVEFFNGAISDSNKLGTETVSGSGTASYTWEGLSNNRDYTWSVKACDSSGDCVERGPWTFQTEFPEFDLTINGESSATPGYSTEFSTEITNGDSITGEVGILEITKNGNTQDSVDVGSLTSGESILLSEFISFGSEEDYEICGKAEEIGKEACMTVTATEPDGSTVWRRLVNFRLDLTGPDSGLGWDQDASWQGMDAGDDYAPNQQDFKQGSSVVFTDVYWQDTYDVVNSDSFGEDDLLEVHEAPMCGDDEREYLLEEMGESINSEKNTGRYACADNNNYCVYRRPSGYKIFDRGEKVNADEDGEDYGRFKDDEAVCAQRPGLSDSTDYNRFPTRSNDLTPQWYDQDYAKNINNDGTGVTDVPDQDICRENTLFGREGVRWIPMSEIANNPHAFTGGIDDSWNPRLEQMNHPYYIADPDGENWDGGENPMNVNPPASEDPEGDAEGFVPIPTGVEDLYGDKVPAPTNMDYGFCGGDDASEYLIHQDSESRFIETDTDVRGLARSPDHCMLDNSRFSIDESDLDRENFDGSNLQNERMIYEEGESISFESGGTTRSAACFSGKWWTDFPVVFLEDEKTVGLGSTGLTTFRVINPRDSSREFNLDLSISNDDLDSKVTFEDTGTNEMTVEIAGETSRTYDLKIRGTGAEEITSNNNVELQAQTTRGDLEGYDDIDIRIVEGLGAGTDTGATRDVPGIQLVQAIVLTLLGSVIFFFTN